MKKLKYLWFYCPIIILSACTYDFPEPDAATLPSAGDASFQKYVAMGNSITAGFMDGALYDRGQKNSYANILAEQFTLVDGGVFNSPDINAENGFFSQNGANVLGRLILRNTPSGQPSVVPTPGQVITPYTGDKDALNNFAVPGVRVIDMLVPGYGALNPLFGRFAKDPATSTLLGDALAALATNSTFFTLWLGNNDALGYATEGAVGEDGGRSPGDLVSIADFTLAYNTVITMVLNASNSKGALINIPNITDIPFFTTVSYDQMILDETSANLLNEAIKQKIVNLLLASGLPESQANTIADMQIQQAITVGLLVEFKAGNNPFLIKDELSALGSRVATPEDLMTLSLGSVSAQQISTFLFDGGIPDGLVLTKAEIAVIQERIKAFNQVIAAAVADNANRLTFWDANAYFEDLANNANSSYKTQNGIGVEVSVLPPFGVFSLDGVHPNGRGHGIIANEIIKTINIKFKANIPLVNPNDFEGNDLPQ